MYYVLVTVHSLLVLNLLYLLTERIGWTVFLQRYGIVPACAGGLPHSSLEMHPKNTVGKLNYELI
jgi:hypothetical protein